MSSPTSETEAQVDRYEATVISTERISSPESEAEVREIVLDVDRKVFSFRIGQSVGVLAPAPAGSAEPYHRRLYSVADLPYRGKSGTPRITICVRRIVVKDPETGQEQRGVASNYLCDRKEGDRVALTGPFGLAFPVPAEKDANLVLIGTGTGIAPFRAFVKHLYQNASDWQGRIWLFHGGRSGLEMLYMNDEKDDFVQYYDQETFEAFKALSPRPNWADPIAWDLAFEERGSELLKMLAEPKTYVYVSGLEPMRDELDAVFSKLAGSADEWSRLKAELVAGQRWIEHLY